MRSLNWGAFDSRLCRAVGALDSSSASTSRAASLAARSRASATDTDRSPSTTLRPRIVPVPSVSTSLALQHDALRLLILDCAVRLSAQRTDQTGLLCRLLAGRRVHDVELSRAWRVTLPPRTIRVVALHPRPGAVVVRLRLVGMLLADPTLLATTEEGRVTLDAGHRGPMPLSHAVSSVGFVSA